MVNTRKTRERGIQLLNLLQVKGAAALKADVNTLKQNRYREFIDKYTATDEQVTFTLTNAPTDAPITMEINGICYYENTDFTVNRQEGTITWTNTDIVIKDDWDIVIRYGVLTSGGSLQVAGSTSSGSGGSYDDTVLLQRISALSNRVTTLENRTDNDTVYDDTALKGRVAALENRPIPAAYDDTALAARVTSLENKTDKDTVYDDTDIKNQLDAMQASIESLESRTDSDTVYDDTDLKDRVTALENRTDSDTVYDDTALKNRITALENRTDSDTVYDDTALKNRITALENRTDSDTVYDDTALSNRVSALEGQIGNFTLGMNVPATAKLTDTVYDDTALAGRVSAVEGQIGNHTLGKDVPSNAVFTDTVYDDTSLASRVTALETQMADVLTRLSTLEGYFESGRAKVATVAYTIPVERKVSDTSTRKAIWYEE